MKLKLPFGRAQADDDDPFGSPTDDEERPSFFASLFKRGGGDGDVFDDTDDGGGHGGRGLLIGALVVIGLIGAVVGYRLVDAHLREQEEERAFLPPTAAELAAKAAQPPSRPAPAAQPTPASTPAHPPTTSASNLMTMAMPPRPGPETALITPPGDVSASDRSTSRRPWLTGGGTASTTPAPAAPSAAPVITPPRLGTEPPPPPPPPPASAAEPAPTPPPASSVSSRTVAGDPLAPPPFEPNAQKAPRFDTLPAPPKVEPLPPAPIVELTAKTPRGLLPVIGSEGQTSVKLYGRPFDEGGSAPRIALVVTDLGLRREATEAAIDRLPANVTLAFSPYSSNLKHWIDRARAAGHEVAIGLPMEPANYPTQDPGPYALHTSLSPEDNMARLETVLGRATGYVGVVATHGSRFLAKQTQILPILVALRQRGLLFLDNGAVPDGGVMAGGALPGLAFAVASTVVDERLFKDSIDVRLTQLVATAKNRRRAVGLASASPLTFERLVQWAATLESKDVQLAPLSAVAVTFQQKK